VVALLVEIPADKNGTVTRCQGICLECLDALTRRESRVRCGPSPRNPAPTTLRIAISRGTSRSTIIEQEYHSGGMLVDEGTPSARVMLGSSAPEKAV